ncbi:cysteine--tRNA ligase [Candidatus Magnetominusculus dajiuhuensis]|uniref:cysteine--tRNA ligase n=1 Tax=Candidatus Magnetominusculus dajiuhuensis TaxID=3137712 RepID=UPI003B42F120
MGLKIYNTMSGKKEEFIPLEGKKVGMYVCGVTVYDLCHVGHARSAVVFDAISRYLRFRGYDVTFVKNFTDIDDKIINRAIEEGKSWDEIAETYTNEYYKDMEKLGVAKPDIEPKATGHIAGMLDIIGKLMDKGYAYETDDGVYYEVGKFVGYGMLSRRDLSSMEAGARVEIDLKKRNHFDFALWKRSKEGEPAWDSPWGAGRPGWHIECSAMSLKHLGETFDIHGGGADLIFPHHENEIAQSCAATGKPFAKYWVHNGFITIDKEKMSKSLGNFFTIRDILQEFDPEVLRVFLLCTHYRSPIEFSRESLRQTEPSIDRVYSTVLRVEDYLKAFKEKAKTTKDAADFGIIVGSFRGKFIEAMDDDFNTAAAVATIFDIVREINRYLDKKPASQETKPLIEKAIADVKECAGVLNIFIKTPQQWYQSLLCAHKADITESEIEHLITKRRQARQDKDWKLADEIRGSLDAKGILLEDKDDGTIWKVKV